MIARLLFLITFALVPSQAGAREPQIVLTVEDGWVSFTLTKDGAPVADARVVVLNTQGGTFASGETGREGGGIFPLPPAREFSVDITTDGRTADRIRITRNGDTLSPREVSLNFGLLPCCRTEEIVRASQYKGPEPIPDWLKALGGAFLLLFGAAILIPRRRGKSFNR